ncbi:allantoin degradation transcriptional regulator AllR [soil metagenome]
MRKMLSPSDTTSRTLVRGLEILRLFGAQRPVLTQTHIAEELGLPLPTVGRLCRALVATGFLELRPESRRLQLGPEIRRLASTGPQGVNDDGRRWMRLLNERFDEDVNLAILDGVHALFLDTLPSTRRLGVKTVVGSRAPAHCTAVGKSLLAQLDDRIVRDRLGPDPYQQRTDKTILRWSQLREELADIRSTGLSRSIEEFEAGLAGFAVPLQRTSEDGGQLALSIAVPTARLQPERASAIESALLAGPHPHLDGVDDVAH